MTEKDQIFSSSIKFDGIFSFSELYQFCYDWLTQEKELIIIETKYKEKLSGDLKNIDIEWKCSKKVTDYFKQEVKIEFQIIALKKVEIVKDGIKIKTNSGSVKISAKGTLVKDYDGKFEKTAFQKFLRAIYEKWVIPARVDQYEEKLVGNCDEFLAQTKAYLDLEGKR